MTTISYQGCDGTHTISRSHRDHEGNVAIYYAEPLDLEHAGYIPADILDRFLPSVAAASLDGCAGDCGECVGCRAIALQNAICEHRVHELLSLWKFHAAVVVVLKEADAYEDGCHPERLTTHIEAGMTPEQAAAEEIHPGPGKPEWVQNVAKHGRPTGA